MSFNVSPLVLEGPGVRLEPLQPDHAEALYAIGQEAEDWLYMPRGELSSLTDTHNWQFRSQTADFLAKLPDVNDLDDAEKDIASIRFKAGEIPLICWA